MNQLKLFLFEIKHIWTEHKKYVVTLGIVLLIATIL
jgi:hypothetical protein